MTLTAAIMAVVNAVLSLVINFGVNLTDAQRASIVGVVNAVLIFGAIGYDQWRGLKKSALPPPPPATGP
jgi:hypothetical protein